jgi:membrane fusion protein (multidrug efflux system)
MGELMSHESHQSPTSKPSSGWVWRLVIKLVIALVAVAAVAGVAMMPPPSKEAPPTEAPPVNVSVMEIVPEAELADTFTLPAVVEPNRVVTVAAEIAASIDRIPPEEGDTVQQGDLLVQLNADLIRPQFDNAQAKYRRDQIEFERMESLLKSDAAPQQDLDNAVSDLAASKAALEEARARFERTRIVSPVRGVLNDLPIEEGEYVSPGTAVAEIVEIDTVKVVVDIPEKDIGFFSEEQKAQVLTDIKGHEKSFEGKITYISQLADRQTRSTPMEITLDNRKGLLRSGQIVRVLLTRRVLNDAIMIPLLAVIPQEVGYAVYVAEDSKAERRDVHLGFIQGDRIQILSGLAAGDKLIVSGHRFVAPGQNVNVESEKK